MKTRTLSFGQAIDYKPTHPERTARKSGSGMNFDVTFKEFPNRAAMAHTIRMQQKREHHVSDWKACVALSDGEGH